jgi:RNA polymerase sigma factor (sigma-70 family)
MRVLFEEGRAGALGDAELLDRFTTAGGGIAEGAFRSLVDRHGPMVLRVCRGVLGESGDAEDAFQATFLVLARKARSIRAQRSLGSWLYGVALRIASDARKAAARRRAHERKGAAMRASIVEDRPPDDDLAPTIQEEIGRLPETYRAAVVLFHLEGLTHAAAAERLGWPLGTVQGRLARARELLRSRLLRRGLTLSAGALASSLDAVSTAATIVTPTLADATVHMAIRLATTSTLGAGAVSGAARALAKGALRMMFWNKVKAVAIVCLGAAGMIAAGALGLARGGPPRAIRVAGPAQSQPARSVRAVGEPRSLNSVGGVGGIVWSADGKRFATFHWLTNAGALIGSEVLVWDVAIGQPTRLAFPKDFHGGTAWAQRAALAPDFHAAAAILAHLKLEGPKTRLYDLTAAYEKDLEPVDSEDTSLLFTPDGKTLVAGRSNGEIRLWSVGRSPALASTLQGPGGAIEAMAIARDGATIATVSGPDVGLWDLRAGKLLRTIQVEGSVIGAPHAVALSPDGKLVAVGACREENRVFVDGVIHLYEVASGRHVRTLKGHETPVTALSFSPDGATLASGGWDKSARLWDPAAGEAAQRLACPDEVWSVAFSPDGKTLAVGGQEGFLRLWSVESSPLR